jgi:hypothetical protein
MKKIIISLTMAGVLFSSAYASKGCILSTNGPICAPPSGGISTTLIGGIVCGKGQCAQDIIGQVKCSKQAGGYATKNILEQVVCTGGCAPGSASLCQRPK